MPRGTATVYTASACSGSNYLVRKTHVSSGATSTVASVFRAQYLALGPVGKIYVTAGQAISRIDTGSQTVESFGFMNGQTYAVTADDTFKMTTREVFTKLNGQRFQVRWVENIATGQRVDYKAKLLN